MPIRKAVPSDIPALNNLLEQILLVHHNVRPDIFQESGRKFNDEKLKTLKNIHQSLSMKMKKVKSWVTSFASLKNHTVSY